MDPEKRTCDRCGHEFEAVTPGQKTCAPCMIKPSAWRREKITAPKEATVPGEKKCKECGAPFVPTCNRQVFCPEHSAKLKTRAAAGASGDHITALFTAAVKTLRSDAAYQAFAFHCGGLTVNIARQK
jgi:hypothetical protein